MKWILCTEDFPPDFTGGVSSWSHDIAEALYRSGEQVHVFARQTINSSSFDKNQSYSITRVRGRKWSTYKGLWMRIALQFCHSDIVIFSCWGLALQAAPFLHRKGFTTAIAVHGSEMTNARVDHIALQKLHPFVDMWFPVSAFLKHQLLRYLPQARATILPMPLSIASQPVDRNPSGPLVCIARKTPFKGIEQTIRLTKKMNRTLWLIGDASYQYSSDNLKGFGVQSRQKCSLLSPLPSYTY